MNAPGVTEILRHFSFDLPWLAALLLCATFYLRADKASRRTNPRVPHPRWRTASFLAGLLFVALATLTPLEHYGNQFIWVNFAGFLVLTMVAAPLILLGSPLTLAFRVASMPRRKMLRNLYRSAPVRFITFPVIAWLLFAVVTYLWQFSTLTELAAQNPLIRDLQQVTLLLVSLTFWLPALASDPTAIRLAYPLRVLYVFLEMTHKGLFGGMFLSLREPFHDWFVANLPAWGPDPMLDQRMGILILWIGGNIIFLLALILLILGWIRYEGRHTIRTDIRLRKQREAEARRKAALKQVFTR
jgi:putative membrane protein